MKVAGLGFRERATAASMASALDGAGTQAFGIDALATTETKTGHEALADFARSLALPLHFVDVRGVKTTTESARVRASFGTGSVAEAAALAFAGPGSKLIVTRVVSEDGQATLAIAEGSDP